MKTVSRLALLPLLIVCHAAPAYANNPPQPDGLLSILLIFPVVIVGWRLAGLARVGRTGWKRIATGIALGICAFLTTAGTGLALIPLLIILVYGIVRGTEIMRHGQAKKKVLIGAAVVAFTLFAVCDYFASLLTYYYPSPALSESIAISRLRNLSQAEVEFSSQKLSKTSPSHVYGAIRELREAQLIDSRLSAGQVRDGYIYGEIIDPAKNEFLLYAVPAGVPKSRSVWQMVVPGGSLLSAFVFRGQRPVGPGERTFAVDETGVIRATILRGHGKLTREEATHWNPLY